MNSTNFSHYFDNDRNFVSNDDRLLHNELNLIEFYLKICEKLLKIYPILLLTIGTFGNLISFIVLMYGSRKKSTTFSYLSCLALIDLAVIATFSINFISQYSFNKDLQDNIIYCKFYAFFVYYLPQYSAWTLSIVSVDRMLALLQVNITHRYRTSSSATPATPLQSPKFSRNGINLKTIVEPSSSFCGCFFSKIFSKKRLKKSTITQQQQQQQQPSTSTTDIRKRFCISKCFNSLISLYNFRISEKYRAFVIVSVIGVLLFLLNSHFLFIYNNNQQGNHNDILSNLTTSKNTSLNTIELLLRRKVVSELSVMILLNGVNVIKCSLEHNQKYKQMYQIWVHIDSIFNVYLPFAVMIISSVMIIMCVLRSMKAAGNYRYHKIARNISVMLVSLNVMFIMLTAPIVIQLAIDASSSANSANITLPMDDVYWYSSYSEHPLIILSPSISFVNSTERNVFYRQANKEIIIVAKRRLIKLICIIIMNSNHACNIMVYCLIGREFRRHFMCAIRRFIYGDSKYKQFYLNHQNQQQYQFNQNAKQSLKIKKLDECECILSTSSGTRRASTFKSSKKRFNSENDNEETQVQQVVQVQKQIQDNKKKSVKYRYKYKIPFKFKPVDV
jgi:hypothetical protein